MNRSIWTAAQLSIFPPLEGDARTDVLIIGGGLAGLLTAHAMAQAGIDYLLIEADAICGGVTMNTTAKVTSQHSLIYGRLLDEFGAETARLYWQANEDALSQYRTLCQSISCDFEEKDSYVYSLDRPERIEREMQALRLLGIPAEYTDSLPLPFSVAGAVRFSNQAQIHPLKFASGIAQSLNIREHTAALAFQGRTVITNRGKFKASHIIVTTHFPLINKHGAYFLKLYQERAYILALENAAAPEAMYLDEAPRGLSLRSADGFLLLGGGAHRTGKPGDGWASLSAFANAHYPNARETHRWATQDCMTLDGIPYIGTYGARTSGLYVATGFNKWGMTSSMIAASILRDMICRKENHYASVFSPARTMLRRQLLTNAFESAANLLTFTTPRCPHMGCALKWNAQEHSWDCPCHGSRFSQSGKLLNTPATGDLS